MALLAQTTLSHDEWRGLMEAARRRFPELWMPNRSDLCFATTNRQAALKAIAGEADAVVVIGSANSSNTVALEKVARASGCPRVVRVNEAAELPDDLRARWGSPPGPRPPRRWSRRSSTGWPRRRGSTRCPVTTEDEYFPPPPELRELLRALATTLGRAGRPPRPGRRRPRGRRPGPSRPPTCSRRWPRECEDGR